MATKEIDEATLQSLMHVQGVVDQIMNNPDARLPFLQLAKQANPRLAIPEVDAAGPNTKAVTEIHQKIDKFLTEQAERDRKAQEDAAIRSFQSKWAEQEAALRQGGWRDKGIEGVKAFAEANGIADLGIAADAFERRNPQPDPAQSAAGGWNLFAGPQAEDTYIKDMYQGMGKNEARLDQEIADTLREMRATR